MKTVGLYCVVLVCSVVACVHGQYENPGVRAILKVYDECSKSEGFSPCLKKKAVTFMDRLARMDKLSVFEGVTVIRSGEVPSATLSEEQLENTLPRALEAREAVLDNMLVDKAANYVSSRTLQITLPQFDAQELGRAISEGKFFTFTFHQFLSSPNLSNMFIFYRPRKNEENDGNDDDGCCC